MGIVETVKGKFRGGPAKEDLRGRLAAAGRELAEATRRHDVTLEQWKTAIQGRQLGRTPILKDKADRLAAVVAEISTRRDKLAGEVAELDREAQLPAPWRTVRREVREARAAHLARSEEMAEARRSGNLSEVRRLRPEVAEAEDVLAAAEARARELAASDRTTREAARAAALLEARARMAAVVPRLDAAYATLVQEATEAEAAAVALSGLGDPTPQVCNPGWTVAGLEQWRAVVRL